MKARLLIIDDDDLVRASLALEASENGYWAATANSGEAALELAQRQTFECLEWVDLRPLRGFASLFPSLA